MPEEYSFDVSELNRELEDELGPGEELNDEDFEEIKVNPPKQPSFPLLVFCFALFKDFFDIISLFVSLGILGSILNIVAWVVIRIYLLRKAGFIKRWLYRRYIFALILEFIPGINVIPQWSIFVLRGYAKEKKNINQVLTAVEKLLLPKFSERFV